MAPNGASGGKKRLVAVLLVTRSRPGPKLVFHYPPYPKPSNGADDGPDSDEDSESDTDVVNLPSPFQTLAINQLKTKSDNHGNGANAASSRLAIGGALGLSEDSLEKLLSPGCWCDRKKFEVSLDGLTFVGYPIYADHDGSWARRHTHAASALKPETGTVTSPKAARPAAEEKDDEVQTQLGITITEPKTPAKPVQDFTHVPESLESRGDLSLATSMNSESTASAVAPETLTSFHVVFTLMATKRESHGQEVSDVYYHIAKKLSKALHHCQKQSSYIGVETRKILTLKAKAKQEGLDTSTLYTKMLESSELAWALKEVYEKISIGTIAGIRLNGMEMSLQIPSHTDEKELDRHSGLLLLEDKDSLLRELAHPEASPLAFFIREHTPTKSLQKQATKLGMLINDVLYLANHLIKWQKARAIAPLHPRNIYIVGPNAPLDQIDYHVAEYARTFSALPSLPQVLRVLSGRPIKYGMLIPSRDHRGPYMDILAYLVRYRFAEQLKISGWLQAPPVAPKKEAVRPVSIRTDVRSL